MPTRLCAEPRCGETATFRGRCPGHARTVNRVTHRNRSVYSSKRWQILRRRVLFEQPLCIIEGCDEIAVDVDHIVAIEDSGEVWSRSNLQAMCSPHHAEKTRRELATR